MWVRIDEITFAGDRAAEVIDHVRNSAVVMHDGDGFRGFRLLMDRVNAHALDVSYWDDEKGAVAGAASRAASGTGAVATTVIRSNVYELSIDAV